MATHDTCFPVSEHDKLRQDVDDRTPTALLDEQDVTVELETIARSHVQAINDRNYDPSSPIWFGIAPTWRFSRNRPGTLSAKQLPFKDGFVEHMKRLFNTYPSYKINIVTMDTTINVHRAEARVVLMNEVTGFPEGIVKENVGVCRFSYMHDEFGVERWLAVGYECLPGMRSW